MLNCKSYRHSSRAPRLEFNLVEAEDLKVYADALPKLVGIGFAIPQSWAQDKLQIPIAKKDEPMLSIGKVSVEENGQAKLKQQTIKRIVALKQQAERPNIVNDDQQLDEMIAQLGDEMIPALQGFSNEVQGLVNNAQSLEELQAKLAALDLNIDEATEVLQLAMVSAELAGRYDVSGGR
jgi:phage gp29-like protein